MKTSTTKQTATKLIPVVSYVRMSSDKQEDSPEQQRRELKRLATANGYEIIREYFDAGRSGTSAKGRPEFQRLMRDVQADPDFRFVLCWDQDRFSRGDATEANYYWHILRQAGIQIHTVNQGLITVDDLGEYLKASVTQMGKRGYVIDLSRNSMRGVLKVAKEGRHVGSIPYGYQHIAVEPNGTQVLKMRRASGTRKPLGWETRLELSDDPREAETVKWLFETYAGTTQSMNNLARELNRRGVPSPRGAKWCQYIVKYILRNRIYTGTLCYGLRASGSLHQVTEEGEIGKPTGNKKLKPAVMVPNAHPAIITDDLFETVQEKIDGRNIVKRKANAKGALLAGLVYCGACGSRMHCHGRRNQPDTYRYECSGAHKGICRCYAINGNVLEDFVVETLRQKLCSPESVRRLREAIVKLAARRSRKHPKRSAELKAQIDSLSQKIKRGMANLLEADPRHVKDLSDMLADLRTQRAAAQAEAEGLDMTDKPPASADVVVRHLEALAAVLKSGNRQKVRDAVNKHIARIDLWFRIDGARFRLAKGSCAIIGPGGDNTGNRTIGWQDIQYPVIFTYENLPGLWRTSEVYAHAVKSLDSGRGVAAFEVAAHLGVTEKTAAREIGRSRTEGLVEVVGADRTERSGKKRKLAIRVRNLYRATDRLFR